jgi:CheY-like chemotaxis protein
MDGYAVAAALRREATTTDALLVAISGFGQEEDKQRALNAGFDLHLTKPVDPGKLEQVLMSQKLSSVRGPGPRVDC